MTKGVKYISDILKEVAQEQNRSYSEVEEVWRLHKKYVQEMIEQQDTYIIEFPHIGNLYFSGFMSRAVGSRYKNRDTELEEKTQKLYEMIEDSKNREGKTQYMYPQARRPNILKLYKSINFNINNKKKKYSTPEKIIKEIENYSHNEQNRKNN